MGSKDGDADTDDGTDRPSQTSDLCFPRSIEGYLGGRKTKGEIASKAPLVRRQNFRRYWQSSNLISAAAGDQAKL
jgi:hypothetical protein